MARSDRFGTEAGLPAADTGPWTGGTPDAWQDRPRRDAGRVLTLAALAAMAIGLAALTAAACALSYASIRALAGQADVSAPLARIYPFVLDAALVLAGCAVLALRGAGLLSRIYGWLCFTVLLAGLAAGATVRAAGITVPRQPAEICAAVLPFALVMCGFSLLIAVLRHSRNRRASAAATPGRTPEPATEPALQPAVEPADAPPDVTAWPGEHDAAAEYDTGQALGEATWVRTPAQPAPMQLRARIPRPSSGEQDSEGQAGAAGVGRPPAEPPRLATPARPATPLMPPVGPAAVADRAEGRPRRTGPRLPKRLRARSETAAAAAPELPGPPESPPDRTVADSADLVTGDPPADRATPGGMKPGGKEPAEAEPDGIEPGGIEPGGAEPARAEPAGVESTTVPGGGDRDDAHVTFERPRSSPTPPEEGA